MMRVLALSAATLAAVEGAGIRFDLTLTVTDTSKFGQDQTKSNGAIKDAIVKHFDGVEDNMVSLWEAPKTSAPTPAKTPAPTPAGESAKTPAPTPTAKTPAPTPAGESAKTPAPTPIPKTPAPTPAGDAKTPAPASENSTETTPAPKKTTPAPKQTTPAPTQATTQADTDSNETDTDSNETDRRLADSGDVIIPVYLNDLPTSITVDAAANAIKTDAFMSSLNAELKTALDSDTDMVTKLSAELHDDSGNNADAAWVMRTSLLTGLCTLLALLST